MYAFIYIDYVEFDHSKTETLNSYKGVYLTDSNGNEIIREYSGDPVVDWANADKRFREIKQKYDMVFYSSCVDHFVMDVEGFRFDENDFLVRE